MLPYCDVDGKFGCEAFSGGAPRDSSAFVRVVPRVAKQRVFDAYDAYLQRFKGSNSVLP